jgi:hypothetical protein
MIRLGKVPDRTPVKLSIAVSPDLHEALLESAAIYAETYGASEPISELIPAMLSCFLDGDCDFARARKQLRASA